MNPFVLRVGGFFLIFYVCTIRLLSVYPKNYADR